MKTHFIVVDLFLSCLLLAGCASAGSETKKVVIGGWCSADAYCTACSNCSRCRNCHVNGGTCSVCAPPRVERSVRKNAQVLRPAPLKKPAAHTKPPVPQKKPLSPRPKIQIKT